MILTVSTVRDTAANVERFVRRNCSQGVDHMFVFLDADQPELVDLLRNDPRVTVIPTAEGWWLQGERPNGLNRRQVVNASAVNCVLASYDWATWLFHIDGDEVLFLDRAELATLPLTVRSVRLAVLEALSSDEEVDRGWFKRQLTDAEESKARQLGLVGRRHDDAYFHGHTSKSGIRPHLGLRYNIHGARTDTGEKPSSASLKAARLLHYESSSFEEFSRKWRNLIESGTARGTKMRPERFALATAFEAALDSGPDAGLAEQHLRAIYSDFVEDPHGRELRELGLLESVAVDNPRYPSPAIDRARLEMARADLFRLAHANKRVLLEGPEELRRTELARTQAPE